MEIPTYITLDYPTGVATPSIQESLGRIAVALEKLAQVEALFAAAASPSTPLNNPPLNSLNLNSLNLEDSEIKREELGDGMQGKGKTKVKRQGGNLGKTMLPKDFQFDPEVIDWARGVLGFSSEQVHQSFNAFRDY